MLSRGCVVKKGGGRGKEARLSSVKWSSLSILLQLTALSRCSSDSVGEGVEGGREREGGKEVSSMSL